MIINSHFHTSNLHNCIARVVVLMRQSADGGMDGREARVHLNFPLLLFEIEEKHEVFSPELVNWYSNLVSCVV